MSEPVQEPQPQPDQAPPTGDPDAAAKRAIDVERKARGAAERHARELEARIKAMDERDLSDLDKANRQNAELEKRLQERDAEVARFKVAAAYGFSDADAVRILHGDERSMTETAARVRELIEEARQQSVAASPSTGPGPAPRPDLSQGARTAVGLNSDELTQMLAAKVGAPRR